MDRKEIGGTVFKAGAARRDDHSHKAVPRDVLGHAVAHPLVVGVERLGPQFRACHQEDVGPLVRPVVDELWPSQQKINQPLVRAW